VPIPHGIEMYRGRPIFYGIGNFIFHVPIEHHGDVPAPYAGTPVFQSVVASCELEGRTLTSLQLGPITLKSDVGVGEGDWSRADARKRCSVTRTTRYSRRSSSGFDPLASFSSMSWTRRIIARCSAGGKLSAA